MLFAIMEETAKIDKHSYGERNLGCEGEEHGTTVYSYKPYRAIGVLNDVNTLI